MKKQSNIKKCFYVYKIFKINNNYLLFDYIDNEGNRFYCNTFKAIRYSDLFNDKIIAEILINEWLLDAYDYKQIGKAVRHGKKEEIFYCYQVNLKSTDNGYFDDYDEVSPDDLDQLLPDGIDKKIMLAANTGKYFNIELESSEAKK